MFPLYEENALNVILGWRKAVSKYMGSLPYANFINAISITAIFALSHFGQTIALIKELAKNVHDPNSQLKKNLANAIFSRIQKWH